MPSKVEAFLTAAQEQLIVEAIRKAELLTSGEIRVHIENSHKLDAINRAQELFHLLKMDNTKEENGVLIYVAVHDKQFAIIGDRGIDHVVPAGFWDSIKNGMELRFRESEFTQGIITAIEETGKKLAQYFPWQHDDINELPNTISKG